MGARRGARDDPTWRRPGKGSERDTGSVERRDASWPAIPSARPTTLTLDTFIARQPIFDRELRVFGYELLYRSGRSDAYDHADPDQATVELLNNSLMVNRLQDLTGGRLGFVNVTENLLLQGLMQVMPPEYTVLELLETVRPTPEVIEAVTELKRAGHRIALDDFEDSPDYAPLIDLADFIKIDFMQCSPAARREIVERLGREGLTFVAEKVETHEDFDLAKDMGYGLFQGFFFCRPQTTTRRDLPRCKVNYLGLIREVSRAELDLDRIEEIVKSEMSLSAKLLRYLNTVEFGLRREIGSIKQALTHLGEEPLKRWATLVAMSGLGDDKPLELVRTCMVRARFCELLAGVLAENERALDLFLTGMFSALDALTDQPMEKALSDVGVSQAVCEAIMGDDSDLSRARALAIACERGDLSAARLIADRFGVPESQVAELYAQSIFWTDAAFTSAVRDSDAA